MFYFLYKPAWPPTAAATLARRPGGSLCERVICVFVECVFEAIHSESLSLPCVNFCRHMAGYLQWVNLKLREVKKKSHCVSCCTGNELTTHAAVKESVRASKWMALKTSSNLLLSGCRRGREVGGAIKMPGQVCGRLLSLKGLWLAGTTFGEQSTFDGYIAHPLV